MGSILRITGGVWIGIISVFAILLTWQDVTDAWFDPFDEVFRLGITLLLLWPGVALFRIAARRENPNTVIPATSSRSPFVRYVRQHWQGEHSLARSCWINTVLLFFAFYGAWDFCHKYSEKLGVLGDEAPVLHTLAFHFIPWLFAFLLTTWQLGGVFRSARRKIQAAPSLWSWIGARSVQVLVGVALLMVAYAMFERGLPDIIDIGLMVPMENVIEPYTLAVLNAGTELEVRGRFNYGLTEDVKWYLEMNPRVRVIRLNSDGGRVAEGRELHDLIQTHHLITYSSIGCFSACTHAFLGGTKRYLNAHAQLGFHTGWRYWEQLSWFDAPGMANKTQTSSRKTLKFYLLDAGVDPQYAKKLTSFLTLDMVYPSPEELLKVGVVHGLSDRVDLVLP